MLMQGDEIVISQKPFFRKQTIFARTGFDTV
jgi:hypothetical protein